MMMKPGHPGCQPTRQHGLSLIELMIALTISAFLLLALTYVLTNAQTAYRAQSGLQGIQEVGRIGLAVMERDIRLAGFAGCTNMGLAFTNNTTDPDPLAIRGFEHTVPGWLPAPAGVTDPPDPNSPVDFNSDSFVVTYAAPIGTVRAPAPSGTDLFFLVSLEGPPVLTSVSRDLLYLSSCRSANLFQMTNFDIPAGEITHGLQLGKTYEVGDQVLRHTTVWYYVGDDAGTPALFRSSDLINTNDTPFLRGVENMQVLYGEDTDQDGLVDDFLQAQNVTNWRDVLSVRVALLVRSEQEQGSTPGFFASHDYNVLDHNHVVNPNSRFSRRLYTTTVRIRNAR